MDFDYSRLRGKIREIFGTQGRFSAATGLKCTSLSQKLNNRAQFSQQEINRCCDALSIDRRDIPDYFFSEKCSERRTTVSRTEGKAGEATHGKHSGTALPDR
jgi:hypothetical protein